ncbi:MAG: AAA family ATPase [Myxococcota bacterium]
MPSRVLPSLDQVRDLELLLKAHHPLILIETVEEDRVATLFEYVADRLKLVLYTWTPHRGLNSVVGGAPIAGTEDPARCLAYIAQSNNEALYHLRDFLPLLDKVDLAAQLKELYRSLFEHRGALILTGADTTLPADLEPLFTSVDLEPPSPHAYYQFVSAVLRDLRTRIDVSVELTSEDVAVLLGHLRGLTFFEVKKVISKAVIEDGRLTRSDLAGVLEAKKRVIQRSGVLDYYPAEDTLADIAGLRELKGWLRKRKAAFRNPEKAKEFGLSAPKGLLLLGVQGCGKSLCAKAVASEWQLPLIRLDPSTLYNKYYGESEKNLRRAIGTAESMAPIVLWIDEIEKAFGGREGSDSGPSQRIFGTFLTWLNDKQESVFVIATANDISQLPPELLRKGRFDEIFFVDLPSEDVRVEILRLHLRRRSRDPDAFDLPTLAQQAEGFSGAELEQVVISALYTAFSEGRDLDDALLISELKATRPLAVTMAEKIQELRDWAKHRAVPADLPS